MQALVLADHGNTFSDIRQSTAGILFLGTPHQGSDSAVYGVWLAQAAGHDTTLLESLERNSSVLHEMARDFEASHGGTDMVCFYEDKTASYGPWRTQVRVQFLLSLYRVVAEAYNTYSWLITSQPACTGKEQCISTRITQG